MTDEELANLDDEAFEAQAALLDDTAENADTDPLEGELDSSDEDSNENDDNSEETTEVDPEEQDEDLLDEQSETSSSDEVTDEDSHEEETEETPNKEDDTDEESEDSTLNYEAEFKQVMEPLKVSGEAVQVKSVQDLRNLAQMGIDYSRKMRDIKPLRAVGETLAKAGIIVDGQVDETALARLVDIANGNKDAIAQLMQEKEIDPLDVDTDDVTYVPETQVVSESTLALQDVEKELVSRGTVDKVTSELMNMDAKSKEFFTEDPSRLLSLEQDISSGTYAQVMQQVRYEKTLGRMSDMSDMEAYIALVSQAAQQTPNTVQTEPQAQPSVQKPSRAKRKAAGISKRAPANNSKPKYDYVNMSDEEFEKLLPTDMGY